MGGIAGALGIGLFSLFPLLIMHQLSFDKTVSTTSVINENNTPAEPELKSDDWEFATEEALESGEWETT